MKGHIMFAGAVLTLALCSSPTLEADIKVEGGELYAHFSINENTLLVSRLEGRVKDGVWDLKCPSRKCDIEMDLAGNYAEVKLKARDIKTEVEMECLQAID